MKQLWNHRRVVDVIILMGVFLVLASGVSAQTVSNVQCDPVSCEIDMGPVLNGEISLSIAADCSDPFPPVGKLMDVTATDCSEPVAGTIKGTTVSEQTIDDCGDLETTQGVRLDGFLYLNGVQKWHSFVEDWCNGGLDGDVPGAAPC
jgi:hypothetical protein